MDSLRKAVLVGLGTGISATLGAAIAYTALNCTPRLHPDPVYIFVGFLGGSSSIGLPVFVVSAALALFVLKRYPWVLSGEKSSKWIAGLFLVAALIAAAPYIINQPSEAHSCDI